MSVNSLRDNKNKKSFLWEKRYSYTSYNWNNAIIHDFTEPEHTSTATTAKIAKSSTAAAKPMQSSQM